MPSSFASTEIVPAVKVLADPVAQVPVTPAGVIGRVAAESFAAAQALAAPVAEAVSACV